MHAGGQVRKAAVRILWEACIAPPGFARASEACVAVLHRVGDAEESIHDLVSKVFHGLWFAATSGGVGPPLLSFRHLLRLLRTEQPRVHARIMQRSPTSPQRHVTGKTWMAAAASTALRIALR